MRTQAGALLLVFGAAIAIIMVNSSAQDLYMNLFYTPLAIMGDKSFQFWINDGLMVVFFFLIGLEIKQAFINGPLATSSARLLPFAAAIGGMIIPALVFFFLNHASPENWQAWAIPVATDIVFALAILAMLGQRISAEIKALLLAIAVIDDLGAIAIIAFFYTPEINLPALALAGAITLALVKANRRGLTQAWIYIAGALLLWLATLQSGIHPTLAGVIAALCVPLGPTAHLFEQRLHAIVYSFILPLFALANAGVSFAGLSLASLAAPLPLGIALGLIIGKPLGIFLPCWVLVKSGAIKAIKITSLHFLALGAICGIGFTMSLFIGALAFEGNVAQLSSVRLGVISGSLASAVLGYSLMRVATRKRTP